MAGANSTKAVILALAANGAIAASKYVAAWVTSSGSMLAEAVHSTADCGNQALLLFGLKRAKRPPSDDYPMGYGKEIYFWSFIVAIMLFSVGGLFSLYEGWHKLHAPEPLAYPLVAIGVLAFGIAAEGFSTWGCLREVNKLRGERSTWQWFRTSRNAELVVILGEDLAALLGLTFALVAVVLAWITGDPMWDALGGMAIGALLIVVAAMVGVQVKQLLVGQGVEAEVRGDMMEFLGAQPAVEKVLKLITLHMGDDVMVAVKARMRDQGSQAALVAAINATEAAFSERFPQAQWVFFEPDVVD
jgi:cation diffusion facilitator family transporter